MNSQKASSTYRPPVITTQAPPPQQQRETYVTQQPPQQSSYRPASSDYSADYDDALVAQVCFINSKSKTADK